MGGALPPFPNMPSWHGVQLGGAQEQQLYCIPFNVLNFMSCA